MFKEELEKHLENPNNADLGKKNIETMEKLVDELKASGEYADFKIKKIAKAEKSTKTVKKPKAKIAIA